MPLYEYRCTECGYSFEKIQNFSAKPETECPKCHGALIRPVTAPALRFAGAGWYVNDYAGKGGTKSGEASGEAVAKGTDSKSESKPDSSASSAAESKPAVPVAAASSSSTLSATSGS